MKVNEFILNIQKKINRERPEINLQDEYTKFFTQINQNKQTCFLKNHPKFKEQQQTIQGKASSLKNQDAEKACQCLAGSEEPDVPTHLKNQTK